MREQGFPKTPDARLEVPIAVDGYIVNWIESKASFAVDFYHRRQLRDQYWAYHNRFGPGMVIYWLGFVEEHNNLKDNGIMLFDDFPAERITLPSFQLPNFHRLNISEMHSANDFDPKSPNEVKFKSRKLNTRKPHNKG